MIIRRSITLVLLLVATITIIVLTMWLSGKSYSKVDPRPFDTLLHLWHRLGTRAVPTTIVAIVVMPVLGNILLFMPWAFLLFISLYSVERPTIQAYVLTILLGFSFSLGIEAIQYFLPSRVADVNDVIWNSVGTIAGALLGHARLRLRVDFD